MQFQKEEQVRLLRSGELLTVKGTMHHDDGSVDVITNNPWGTADNLQCAAHAVEKL